MKITYEVLAHQVDQLYPPHYQLKENQTIDEHLLYIESFIEACGWTTEDFLEEYIHRGFQDLLINLN